MLAGPENSRQEHFANITLELGTLFEGESFNFPFRRCEDEAPTMTLRYANSGLHPIGCNSWLTSGMAMIVGTQMNFLPAVLMIRYNSLFPPY